MKERNLYGSFNLIFISISAVLSLFSSKMFLHHVGWESKWMIVLFSKMIQIQTSLEIFLVSGSTTILKSEGFLFVTRNDFF